ncbi:hypothetical protein ACFYO2_02955 [Streptomyces sp. NPDC006602]|uniref:hypothetical protein n=1 Tax=Streptomyces sp. NPDC006602 TaxID=3364751 RepID=UPI003679DA84
MREAVARHPGAGSAGALRGAAPGRGRGYFRNDLTHFSPDPITDAQLLPAQGLLELLRSVDPQV